GRFEESCHRRWSSAIFLRLLFSDGNWELRDSHGRRRLKIVAATPIFAPVVVQATAALQLIHGFIELRPAHLVAHLLAHPSERARDALGVVLVNVGEARGI